MNSNFQYFFFPQLEFITFYSHFENKKKLPSQEIAAKALRIGQIDYYEKCIIFIWPNIGSMKI